MGIDGERGEPGLDSQINYKGDQGDPGPVGLPGLKGFFLNNLKL